MIKFADQYIVEFCDWLSTRYPAEDVSISILHGFDSIDAGADGDGFAAYNPETRSIICADPNQMKVSFDLSEEDMVITALSNIAHEFRHHMQNIGAEQFSEDDAERFASAAVDRYVADKNK